MQTLPYPYKFTPKIFFAHVQSHLTSITKQNECVAPCYKGVEIQETKIHTSYIAALTEGNVQYKNFQHGWGLEFLTFRVQLVANNREQVYFEQQILILLLVRPTPNIKFAHVLRLVKGLCISWSSPKAYHIEPSMLWQNQPWMQIEKQQELPLATM